MKKKLIKSFLIILFIFLIGGNIYFLINYRTFSNDSKDNKLIKISTKYQKETDEYKFNVVYDCIDKLLTYVMENNYDVVLQLLDKKYIERKNIDISTIKSLFRNINDFTLLEEYKTENKNNSIYYVSSLIEQDKSLKNMYFMVYLDYNNKTYLVEITNEKEYNLAKQKKQDRITSFEIEPNEYNTYEYNYSSQYIVSKYIKDFYLKNTYLPEEANKILQNNNGKYNNYLTNNVNIAKQMLKEEMLINKEINEDNITYNLKTTSNVYKIVVKEAMNYKIVIE